MFSLTLVFKQYQDYFLNYETRTDSAYSIDNLFRTKGGVHIIILNGKQ